MRGSERAMAAAVAAIVIACALGVCSGRAQSLQDVGLPNPTATSVGPVQGTRLSGEQAAASSSLELQKSGLAVSQAGPVDPATYVLGPGDVLQLELWGGLVRSVLLEVSPDGKLFLSGSGPLQVAGRTLEWSQEHVKNLVAETFRGVHADLRLVRLRSFRVYVAGYVDRQGAVDVSPVVRASEAIARVGLAAGGSRRNIEIRRRDGRRLRVDLDLFDLGGRQDFDPLLEDGDVVTVPRAVEFVQFKGAFKNTRTFERVEGDSLGTLLRLAGGLLPSASRDRLLLVRFSAPTVPESLWLDVSAVESGASNPVLRDGDVVFAFYVSGFHVLPSVEIYGEVVRPGAYPITLGKDHLSDLTRWAGGFRPNANRSAIYLLRTSEGAGTDPEFERLLRLSRAEMTESEYATLRTRLAERKNSFRVDYDRIVKSDPDVDPLLHPQDVVRVDPLLMTVRVDGAVRRPGLVDFAAGRPWSQYIQLAGGFTDRASRSTVQVSRSATGQVIKARSMNRIQPGDFIWVPEKRDLDAWMVFRDVVTVAGQVAVIVLATRK